MAGVTKNEYTFAGQVGRVNRPCIPGCPGGMVGQKRFRIDVGQRGHFADKVDRSADTDRNNLCCWLFEIARQPLCSQ